MKSEVKKVNPNYLFVEHPQVNIVSPGQIENENKKITQNGNNAYREDTGAND